MTRGKGFQRIIQTLMLVAIILIINVIAQYVHSFMDLTEEKRFTLSKSTQSLLEDIDDVVYIKVLLDGEFPAGFKRLQNSTIELLDQFRAENPLIDYELDNPSDGQTKEINSYYESLRQQGIYPTNLMVRDGEKNVERLIFPYAIVSFGNKKVPVNLLEPQMRGVSEEVILNNSVSLLEYKFANAINKLLVKENPNIVFTEGNGELEKHQTAKLFETLKSDYDIGRINLDSIVTLKQDADLLVVAQPKQAIDERAQFKIDQYIMNGGRVIWLLDQFFVNLDSIDRNRIYVPKPIEHGLDDLLFKYGVKLRQDLVLDLENSRIPQVIGMTGGQAQTSLFPWYYHPLIAPKSEHPIVKSIDRVNLKFPSSLDTVQTKSPIKKEILLSSSTYSRRQIYPMRLSFEIIRVEPDVTKFNKKNIPIGILLDGEFESAFNNRLSKKMEDGLKKIGVEFKAKSPKTKQLVVGDGDFIKNLYNQEKSIISPIGYNQWEETIYNGNRDFIINAIEYMLDDFGLLESRTKDVKLRLLNKVKTQQERTKWQLINILLPILFILIFGFIYTMLRKKKYGANVSE